MNDWIQKIPGIHADNTIREICTVSDSVFIKLEGEIEPVDLEIEFLNCQLFHTNFGWSKVLGVDGLWFKENSELLNRTILAIKRDNPDYNDKKHKYKHFQFIDDDGNILVELIAEDYEIS